MKNGTVASPSGMGVTKPDDKGPMVDIPLSPDAKVTVERRTASRLAEFT
jgi:hypothetical protein